MEISFEITFTPVKTINSSSTQARYPYGARPVFDGTKTEI